jgi:hypothetical protein
LLAEALVLIVFILTKIPSANFKKGFLLLNKNGAFGVVFFSLMLNNTLKKKSIDKIAQ